ncbi:hypothetical protein [Paenibacillus naphthalenovorans]|uniref:Uncharacterized protein n=1 Tax=Paenibacillus naphthalenovorans TaxID=162209 RepID=A0A0U2KZ02_9BACL|nr:hypothetical protein [Paenibacillus naphthalenovorans]ALS22226.1 hypothetical protein IJ22_18520 [Paenibacillus naphthalenovorans]
MKTEGTVTVWGKVEFFIYHPTQCTNHEEAIQTTSDILNSKRIHLLEGNIHTTSGEILPIVVKKLNVTWIDTIGENDI